MTDRILKLIDEKYKLSCIDVGNMSTLCANGMKFKVSAYNAEGLGHVSVMTAKGFFGLMKMDTLIINPLSKDLPLYSYDRIYAMGNDTLIVELYDTLIKDIDTSDLDAVKEKYKHLPERDPGEHWYDGIKLAQSISKKSNKKQTAELDRMTVEHFEAYLNIASDESDKALKKEKAAVYVNGLLRNGGPSTDVFKKAIGEDKTAELFGNVLFGIT